MYLFNPERFRDHHGLAFNHYEGLVISSWVFYSFLSFKNSSVKCPLSFGFENLSLL